MFILKSLNIDCIVYHGIGEPLYLKLPKLYHEYYLLDLCNLCHLVINNHNNFRRGRKNMDWPKWNELHASAWGATICILRKQDRLDRLQHCKWNHISWRKKIPLWFKTINRVRKWVWTMLRQVRLFGGTIFWQLLNMPYFGKDRPTYDLLEKQLTWSKCINHVIQ